MMMTVPNFFPLDRGNFGIISSGSFCFFYFSQCCKNLQRSSIMENNYKFTLQERTDPPQTGVGTEGLLTNPGFIYKFQTHTDKF